MTTHLHEDLAGREAYQTGAQAYVAVLQEILLGGLKTTPRGLPCRELVDACVYIEDASKAVPAGTGRLVNPRIGSTEYAQLLAGVSFLEQLNMASGGRFSQFADGGRLLGAYGPRVYPQLPLIAELLQRDKHSRQAIVQISRGMHEQRGSHDTPCTLSLQFKIRDGKLNCTVMMRSSDAWLGIPYDWWQFSRLQMTMAWALGVETGTFTFFAGSLHLYEKDVQSAERIVSGAMSTADARQPPAITYITDPEPGLRPAARVRLAQAVAEDIVLHNIDHGNKAIEYMIEHVPMVTGNWTVCDRCRYVWDMEDAWIQTCLACQ